MRLRKGDGRPWPGEATFRCRPNGLPPQCAEGVISLHLLPAVSRLQAAEHHLRHPSTSSSPPKRFLSLVPFVGSSLQGTGGGTGRVSRNTSPCLPDYFPLPLFAWTPADLSNAVLLDLGTVPVQPGALALVSRLTDMVAAHTNRRWRPTDLAKLHRAVGALVGGILHQWRKGRAVFRSRERGDFTGELVGNRPFLAAVDGLVALGQLATKGSISYATEFGDGAPGISRRAARLCPTARLLEMAAEHGIGPGNVAEQFGLQFSRQPPRVPTMLVERRPIRTAYRASRTPSGRSLLEIVRPDDAVAQGLSKAVHEANQFIAGFDVQGCLPPRWRRPFGPSWLLGGRWTALGSSRSLSGPLQGATGRHHHRRGTNRGVGHCRLSPLHHAWAGRPSASTWRPLRHPRSAPHGGQAVDHGHVGRRQSKAAGVAERRHEGATGVGKLQGQRSRRRSDQSLPFPSRPGRVGGGNSGAARPG